MKGLCILMNRVGERGRRNRVRVILHYIHPYLLGSLKYSYAPGKHAQNKPAGCNPCFLCAKFSMYVHTRHRAKYLEKYLGTLHIHVLVNL